MLFLPIGSQKHASEQTTILDNPMYGVVGLQSEDDEERELDNPIYGADEDTGYETPHFEVTYSSMDTYL